MTLQTTTLTPPLKVPPTSTQLRGSKVMTVEFWRFIFTVLVCLFHLEIYFGRQVFMPAGSSAVEFFFILAGFTMAMSATRYFTGRTTPVSTKEAHAKAVDFVKNKLKAIYPILIVAMILWIATAQVMPGSNTSKLEMLQNTEWEWLMLVGTPFGNQEGVAPIIPLWFLTALLIVGYLYTFAIYKKFDFIRFAAPVIGILFYIFFAMNAEKILDFFLPMGFFNAAMVRGIAEMSFGMSVYFLYEYLSKKKLGVIWQILLTVLELYAIFRFFQLTLWQPLGIDNFRRIPYIMIIVLLSFLNVSFFSKALNKLGSLWRRAGSISLTMYLCHLPMVNVYFYLLNTLKMKVGPMAFKSPMAKAISDFLQGTGGYSANFKPNPMTWKDMVMFIPLVIITAILVTLLIAAIKKFIAKPLYARYKRKLAEQDLLAASAVDAAHEET